MNQVLIGALLVAAALGAPPSSRGEGQATTHQMASETAALRAEVDALRRELVALRTLVAREPVPEAPAPAPPPSTPTATPSWLDRLTLKGRAWLRYSYEFGSAAGNFNEFDIDRGYLEFNWKVAEKATLRFTLEGGDIRDRDRDGKRSEHFDVATKYLYLELRDVLHPGSYARFGQVGLPWVPFEETLWQYRFHGKVFADREGYLTSTDLGATVGGAMPGGWGSWAVALVNGEGWKRNEIGKHVDVHARLTLHPLARVGAKGQNFVLGAFTSLGTYDDVATGPNDRRRRIVHAGWVEKGAWTLAGSYLWTADPADKMRAVHPSLELRSGLESKAEGFSLWWLLNLGAFSDAPALDKWELVTRYDRLDPDKDISDNTHSRWTLGVSHRFNKWVRAFVGAERQVHDPGALRDDQTRGLVQAEVTF